MSKNFQLLKSTGRYPGDDLHPEVIASDIRRDHYRVNPDTQRSDIASVIRILHKRWHLATISAALIFAAVAIATFLTRPLYEPTARIEVDPPGSETFTLDRRDTTDPEWVDTQVDSLQSDGVLIATIRQLRLDRDKDFAGNAKEVRAEENQKQPQGPGENPVNPAESAALRSLKSRLTVSRKMRGHMIAVSVAAHDPALAALVTNTLISTYTDRYYSARYDAVMRSSELLSRQLDDVREKLRQSNQALADYQKSTGIADIDDKQSTVTQSLLELNRQLAQAQGDRIQLEASLSRVAAGNAKSLAQIHDGPVTQFLARELDQAKAELSQAQVIYGDQHPKVKTLHSKVEQLQQEMKAEEQSTVDQLRTSYHAARSREGLLVGQLRDITSDMSRMAHYNSLKKDAQANSELYNALYARVKEAGIAAASRSSNINIVDNARILDRPTRPRRTLNLGIGFVLALLGGVVVGFAREAMDPTLRSPEDIRRWTGLPALSLVPKFRSRQLGLGHSGHFLSEQPNSPQAEAVRVLFTALMLTPSSVPPRTLLIASPCPGDGKTTIAINLALALARRGSTCIVDADLRRKSMSAHFDLASNAGIADVVAGERTLDDALVNELGTRNLSLLPAGASSGNAGEIIISERMRDLVSLLREQFQFVVIDSPPILPYADSRALAKTSDGVILVGRYALTTREALNCAAQLLAEARVPILGVVLNGVDLNAPDYRYYGYADVERSYQRRPYQGS